MDVSQPVSVKLSGQTYVVVGMESELPAVQLNMDESKGSIEDMNDDPNHDTECFGAMTLSVPEKLAEENGWETTYIDTDMSMKGRGNTTWGLPKKPYQIKLDSKQDILGMGKAKKWVLLANYGDRSLD